MDAEALVGPFLSYLAGVFYANCSGRTARTRIGHPQYLPRRIRISERMLDGFCLLERLQAQTSRAFCMVRTMKESVRRSPLLRVSTVRDGMTVILIEEGMGLLYFLSSPNYGYSV